MEMCIHSNEMRTMQCIYTIQFIYFHFFLFLFFGSILPFFVFIFYFLILCLFFYTIWNMITTIKTTIPQRHPLHNLDAVRDAPDADNALIVLRIYAYYDTCTSHAGTHDTFISSLRKPTTHVCACTNDTNTSTCYRLAQRAGEGTTSCACVSIVRDARTRPFLAKKLLRAPPVIRASLCSCPSICE